MVSGFKQGQKYESPRKSKARNPAPTCQGGRQKERRDFSRDSAIALEQPIRYILLPRISLESLAGRGEEDFTGGMSLL